MTTYSGWRCWRYSSTCSYS